MIQMNLQSREKPQKGFTLIELLIVMTIIGILATFPIVLTTHYLGNPDPGTVLCGYLGSILLAGAYVSIGMLAASRLAERLGRVDSQLTQRQHDLLSRYRIVSWLEPADSTVH